MTFLVLALLKLHLPNKEKGNYDHKSRYESPP